MRWHRQTYRWTFSDRLTLSHDSHAARDTFARIEVPGGNTTASRICPAVHVFGNSGLRSLAYAGRFGGTCSVTSAAVCSGFPGSNGRPRRSVALQALRPVPSARGGTTGLSSSAVKYLPEGFYLHEFRKVVGNGRVHVAWLSVHRPKALAGHHPPRLGDSIMP